MSERNEQLISYIAPAAPATRRQATGKEAFLRPEIGFTPRWYHEKVGIDFGERWHNDPAYRRETVIAMRDELKRRFSGTSIGMIDAPDLPLDVLTGTFGACTIAAIYGIPIVYAKDNWPQCAQQYLSDAEADQLQPAKLDDNPFFNQLVQQVEWIAEHEGCVRGFINWQGVLNNAHRLRGHMLFIDLIENPERVHHLLECVCTTMIEAAKRLYLLQRKTGIAVNFFTVSNCLVNMVSAQIYSDFLLPHDQRIAREFGRIGIHNCAWNANPYLDAYSRIPHVAYIDMGMESNLSLAKTLFPRARRAIMYTPMDVANKSLPEIRADLKRIADGYGPCDIVAADIEADTPDDRVFDFIGLCEEIGDTLR